MDHDGRSSGNHPGIIEFKGKWYCFGFNYERYKKTGSTQHCERRSVCVAEMKYNPDGTIVQMPWWAECPEIDGREPVIEIKAFQHPDKRGGLMLNIRVDGGEWRGAAGRDRVFGLDPAAPAVQYAYRLGFDAVALNTSSPRRILQNAAYASAKVPAEFWNGL